MKLVRQFEQRLEGLLDGWATRVFSGPLHPTELASRLIRTADLSLDRDRTAHNAFELVVSAGTDGQAPAALIAELERLIEQAALERGWRMEGPAEVSITVDQDIRKGSVYVTSGRVPGSRPAWAVLLRDAETLAVTVNHATIGRDSDCDVTVDHDQVSRTHAKLWAESDTLWLADLGSSNGTAIDGVAVTTAPRQFDFGAIIRLADLNYRIERP